MARREFTRAIDRVLARLGEDAVLRGAGDPVKVAFEFSVEMQGAQGEVAFVYGVATMKRELDPKVGDSIALVELVDGVWTPTGKRYIVDSPPFADNGYSVRVAIREKR